MLALITPTVASTSKCRRLILLILKSRAHANVLGCIIVCHLQNPNPKPGCYCYRHYLSRLGSLDHLHCLDAHQIGQLACIEVVLI